MGLIVNHNIAALNAANNLSVTYSRLARSVSRLSSGLRITNSRDDAAGLAVRELMRSDIRVIAQGIRNAQDAINMLMTADGAMSVIDEKLIRMKELAEQAATGTYTTAQREIMNDEFSRMAAEITRIANATDFNGIKLLDGTLSTQHGGDGLKIHFGTGDDSAEDYYYVDLGSMTAQALGVDANATAGSFYQLTNMNQFAASDTALNDDGYFGFFYNSDGTGSAGTDAATLADVFGIYRVTSGMTLSDVAAQINEGTAARATLNFGDSSVSAGMTITINGVTYEFVASAGEAAGSHIEVFNANLSDIDDVHESMIIKGLLSAINNQGGEVWAVASLGTNSYADLNLFGKNGAPNYTIGVTGTGSYASASFITNATESHALDSGTYYLNGGGSAWIAAEIDTQLDAAGSTYYRLRITGTGAGESYYIAGIDLTDSAWGFFQLAGGPSTTTYFAQETGNDDWDVSSDGTSGGIGGSVSIATQSGAQAALSALDAAIVAKDQGRAKAGATANRLQNTVTAMTIQAENLQASEANISDADIATEMTEYTRNMILVQSGVAMLAQANSLSNLALTLLGA